MFIYYNYLGSIRIYRSAEEFITRTFQLQWYHNKYECLLISKMYNTYMVIYINKVVNLSSYNTFICNVLFNE